MLAKIAESGLKKADLKRLQFSVVTAKDFAEHLPELIVQRAPIAGGFKIPYFDLKGEPTDFYRFRYLEPPERRGFAALAEHKELRYIQPAKVAPLPYFSPLFDWMDFIHTASQKKDLWFGITEGENKGNAAAKLGIPALALGGVWSFRSSKNGKSFLPELASLPFQNANVFVFFDSDAVTNPDVLSAENALCRELINHGANPYVCRIPPLVELEKTGLDDYLVKVGAEGFSKLQENAELWKQGEVLHSLNERVLFLRADATVLELKTRNRWKVYDFCTSVYAKESFVETASDSNGNVSNKEKNAAREWIKWPYRAEVERLTYKPGEPLIVDNEYNAWQGWGIPTEHIKPGDITPWKTLIEFLFQGADAEYRRWFEQWMAYPIQHPGTKMFQAVVMWGLRKGTGKTLVGHTMERIYGPNYTEINERELHSGFNEWAACKQFCMGDEITGGDKRQHADFLKGLITQKFLRINPKHVKPYVVPDCLNYFFTSNHPDAFFLEDKDERRYFIIEVIGAPLADNFYRAYDKWYRSVEGAGALFYHFLNVDCKGFNPMAAAPSTRARLEMLSDGRSDVGSWVAKLKENPDEALRQANGSTMKQRMFNTRALFSCYTITGPGLPPRPSGVTENGLARELKRAGFRKINNGEPVFAAGQAQRLWAIRDAEQLLKITDMKEIARIHEQDVQYNGLLKEAKKKEKRY